MYIHPDLLSFNCELEIGPELYVSRVPDVVIDMEFAGWRGRGWLGAMPPANSSIDGEPAPVNIDIQYNPGLDTSNAGRLVARTSSDSSGVWMVTGLNERLVFDVVGYSPGKRSAIVKSVKPIPMDVIGTSGGFTGATQNGVDGSYVINGGIPPYTVDIPTTAYPTGFLPTIKGWNEFVMVGTTQQSGSFDIVAVITSSNGIKTDVSFNLTL